MLAGNRVAFTSYAGVLHVLDRRDGHVVQTLGPGAPRRAPGGRRAVLLGGTGSAERRGVLLALRLRDWGVQLRRLP